MKVILNKDIPNLGEEGDIKDVARGYARNYLIPNQLVMPYTAEALAYLASRQEQLAQRREEKRKAALDTKTRLESEDLVLKMPAGERGRLFGSVTGATIVEALEAKGISVERKRLEIPEKTIKTLGTTRVRVRLYDDEEAELKVVVESAGAKASEEAAAAAAAEAAAAGEAPAEEAVAEAAVEEGSADEATAGEAVIDDAEASETAAEVESEPAAEESADEAGTEDAEEKE